MNKLNNVKRIILLLICLFIASLNLNFFLKELDLVTGGTQGLSLIIHHLLPLTPFLIVLIINCLALVISYFFLPKDNTYSALIATFAYPFFIKITSFIPHSFIKNDAILLWSIIAGLIFGFTSGFIYKLGFSSGGITIATLLINKYLKVKIALTNFIINSLIIVSGYYTFGLKKTLYSLIVIFLGSFIIHLILNEKKTTKPLVSS